MTLDQDAASILPAEPEGPADPRPAWERIAYTWLDREIDHGQPVDPTALAAEVSVAPGLVLQPEFVTWLVEGQGRGADEGGHRRSWRCANNQRSDGGRRPRRRG